MEKNRFKLSIQIFLELIMDMYAKEKSYEEYRMTGVHRILLDIPDKTEEVKMVKYILSAQGLSLPSYNKNG